MRLIDEFFIIENMSDTEYGFYAELRTNPEHFIYKAHFPGNPITPGVCIIQAAGELLENRLNRELFLKSIKTIKFLSVITPKYGKTIKYVFSFITEDENGVNTQVLVRDDVTIYAKISMTFSNVQL